MESGYARDDKTRIYWESHGEGPAVLFIHAGVADSRMWAQQMGLEGYRTVVFDKRGFGSTAWVPGPFSDSNDAMTILDHLGIETATVVGCSMGGGTALDLAIDHPDRLNGLVLVGAYPSGWVPPGGFEDSPLEEEAAAAAEARDHERMVDVDYRMWLVGYGRPESEVEPTHRDLFLAMDRVPVLTEAERGQYQTGFEKRFNEHLEEIDLPALVMAGAHDEPLLVDAARYMAGILSDREAVIVPNAAHLPSLEQPEPFNSVLRAFLDTL